MYLPLEAGGGPTGAGKVYQVLRSAVGEGGSAVDDSGLDGLWRRARAIGLEASSSSIVRAINNGWPHLATDLIPYYERVLKVVPPADAPEAARREEVAALWPSKSSALIRDIESELKRIDSRFSVVLIPEAYTTTGIDGRWFGPNPGATESPAWSGSSVLAAETTRYLLYVVLFVIDESTITNDDMRSISNAERLLRSVQPSWCAFTISVASDGFTLGVSILGMTGLW